VAHKHAVEAMKNFLRQKPIDQQLDDDVERKRTAHAALVQENRGVVGRLFSVTRLLGRLCLPFRGQNEGQDSLNKGVLVESATYLANHGDTVLKKHFEYAPKNAQYLSPKMQNE